MSARVKLEGDKKVKIKRTNRGAAPIPSPAGSGRAKNGAESTSGTERTEIADKVSLSDSALAASGVEATGQVDADQSGMPAADPDLGAAHVKYALIIAREKAHSPANGPIGRK